MHSLAIIFGLINGLKKKLETLSIMVSMIDTLNKSRYTLPMLNAFTFQSFSFVANALSAHMALPRLAALLRVSAY